MAANNARKVVINVSAKDFEVKCSEEFAACLEDDIALLSGGTNKIELKRFVEAFVQKNYELYILEKKLKKTLNNIANNLENASLK